MGYYSNGTNTSSVPGEIDFFLLGFYINDVEGGTADIDDGIRAKEVKIISLCGVETECLARRWEMERFKLQMGQILIADRGIR